MYFLNHYWNNAGVAFHDLRVQLVVFTRFSGQGGKRASARPRPQRNYYITILKLNIIIIIIIIIIIMENKTSNFCEAEVNTGQTVLTHRVFNLILKRNSRSFTVCEVFICCSKFSLWLLFRSHF